MGVASKDVNSVATLIAVSNVDGVTPVTLYADPVTHRLLTQSAGSSGTVTSVSVVTANGFAGTVATATTTPAITLSTTVTGILYGNGTAISAATISTGLTLSGSTLSLDSKLAPLDTLGSAGQLIRVNAGATALEYFTASSGGVASVVGTANRITVDSTDPANPIVDIAATYVGQTSITTLGTIATGTWSATTIALNKGGTGQTTKAAAFDALSPMTTGGDIIYGGASGTGTRLANGNAGDVLTSAGTTLAPTWAAPASATTITVANEASDTTCFPVFVTAATGALGPKSNAGLTFNSNTSSLGATLMTATTSLTTASVLASSNGSGSIGASGTAFSNLFLASTGTINFAAGNVVLTHSTGILTQTAGELRITSANVGTNADSVPTLSSTSTMTNKTLTSPVLQTLPVLAAAAQFKWTVPSSDGTGTGIITNEFNSGYSSTAIGDLVYLDSSATWQKADADASATTYSSILGIALSVTASGAAATVLLQGYVYAATPFPTFTIGAPIYMSATAGAVTQTAPVTTDSATRIIGYGVHADKMWFNPDNTYVVHT